MIKEASDTQRDRQSTSAWAVVPVKRLAVSKQRLAAVLGTRREEFASCLALRTLDVLARSGAFAEIIVATSDSRVAADARARGAIVIDDAGGSLNEACVLGIEAASEWGAGVCALVPADLATLTPEGTAAVVARYLSLREHRGSDAIGLVRCKDGTGTNMVLLDPSRPFAPAFGADSFSVHMHDSQGRGHELSADEVAFDLDTVEDLQTLASKLHGSASPDPLARLVGDLKLPHTHTGHRRGHRWPHVDAQAMIETPVAQLIDRASELRDEGHGSLVTYSRKVFLPLTHLCRDSCHYCTFAQPPRRLDKPFMTVDEAVATAEKGAQLGCKEALFTLGERPEARYRIAREWLQTNGFASTLHYVNHVAAAVRDRTGLLPHINAGCMTPDEMAMLRSVSASMGLMLESAAARLCAKGGPHHGSPDKVPAVRLETIAEAGRQKVPFTTGLLIGIGETRAERIEALLAIRDLHHCYRHIQEIIIQNFVPKPGTRMANAPAASLEELLWTIAVARMLFGPQMSIQAPPNLSSGALTKLLDAGINDWGGVSPLTPDYVNPEAPWPQIERLREQTAAAGKTLAERLTIYPCYAKAAETWLDPAMRRAVLELSDASARGRENSWLAGRSVDLPTSFLSTRGGRARRTPIVRLVDDILDSGAEHLDVDAVASLFEARGPDFHYLCDTADEMRAAANGDVATYVVNRNINYTNICSYRCTFCAFSKGPRKHAGAEKPYLLGLEEIANRTREARERGGTEVCLQGGIHPSFTGETYLGILRAVKHVDPAMHVHAFSPLEVWHGATTLGMSLSEYLTLLRENGLGSLPGTAAEILHDTVRKILCPDKLTTDQWLQVIEAAHEAGLRTTATIMFGHVDDYRDWAIHLRHIRDLHKRTGGITEFVPLPFVAFEAPLYRRGQARPGPTLREAVLMHAVARLTLHPYITNIQASWVKMGRGGMREALRAGANDLGGTLMNESITRAAGATHGQEMTVAEMRELAASLGRTLVRRTTLYGRPDTADRADAPATAARRTSCTGTS